MVRILISFLFSRLPPLRCYDQIAIYWRVNAAEDEWMDNYLTLFLEPHDRAEGTDLSAGGEWLWEEKQQEKTIAIPDTERSKSPRSVPGAQT